MQNTTTMRILKSIFILALISFFSFHYGPNDDQNQFTEFLANSYCSNAKDILNKNSHNISKYAQSNSLSDVLTAFPTMVHEHYHRYTHSINLESEVRKYFINDDLTIEVNTFPVFRSEELNAFVDEEFQNQIFRYQEYISSDDLNLDSQANGIFGILEEYTAYYQDLLAYQELYGYLRDHIAFSESQIWVDYLIKNADVLTSGHEFKLFISWYMQYAKIKHPKTYSQIVQSEQLKKLYKTVNDGFQKASEQYYENRATILDELAPYIDQRALYIRTKGDRYFYELPDQNVSKVASLLCSKEHEILLALSQ